MTPIHATLNGAASHPHSACRADNGQFRPNDPSRGSPELAPDPGKARIQHLPEVTDRELSADVRLTQTDTALVSAWSPVAMGQEEDRSRCCR